MSSSETTRTLAIHDPQVCLPRIVSAVTSEKARDVVDAVPRIPSYRWQPETVYFVRDSDYAFRFDGPYGLVLFVRVTDYRVALAALVHDSEPGARDFTERLLIALFGRGETRPGAA
jgi:hypothetical protein